ncbi:MAG: S8 family serine peptidase [Thermoplasmata archaeon]
MRNASVSGLSLVVVVSLLSLMAPAVAAANDSGGPMIVDLKAPATPEQLAALEAAGLNGVHGYKHLPLAAGNLPQGRISSVLSLNFVVGIREDSVRTPTAQTVTPATSPLAIANTWNLDFIDKEKTAATGEGVYVALLDAGLLPMWRDFLDEKQVRVDLGRSFTGHNGNPVPDQLENDRNGHGTATAATIIGYKLHDKSVTGGFLPDSATGTPGDYLMPGVAPKATIVPIKVCDNGVYCWDSSIYSAWDYVIELKEGVLQGKPIVINMSLGGSSHSDAEEALIQRLVDHGILIVASAGNDGPNPMGWPGAYPIVISAGAGGWQKQWNGDQTYLNNQWWMDDVPEGGTGANEWFMVWWSGYEYPNRGQELDVVAPGRFMLLPYIPDGKAYPPADPAPPANVPNPYYFISGTSFSAPTTTGVVALMLSVNAGLTQAQAEKILRSTAMPIPAGCWFATFPYTHDNCWDTSKSLGGPGHQTGWGLVQADGAVQAAMDGTAKGGKNH